jgi:hypothetical protein
MIEHPSNDSIADGEAARQPVIDEILAAIQVKKLVPARTPIHYQVGLLLVAIMMVLLPAIYVALIGGVGFWSWLVFSDGGSRLRSAWGIHNDDLIFFSGFIGIIAVFFLIKPLFARRGKGPAPLTIGPDEEPALRAFVDRIAEVVGAPKPRAIEVDCEVNAAAGFRRGFWSLFTNDLKLIIGLPLAGGLDLRCFGGVLAHEFGHFAQGTGMRLTYLIRTINAWFARVVYERDAWDERLAAWSRGGDLRLMIFLMAVRLFIWFSRRILWVLMHIGHGISCFAMRQMEYDADSYEAQFAGSSAFAETSRQMILLGIGSGRAQHLLGEAWEQRQLARNLPGLGIAQARALPGSVRAEIEEAEAGGKTGLFDTHPSNADRIAAARRLDFPGVFTLETPATVLFGDYEALAERASRHHYAVTLETEIGDELLVDNALIEGVDAARREAYESLDRFLFGGVPLRSPVFVTLADLRIAPDVTDADIVRLRDALKAERDARKAEFEELDAIETRRDNATRASELLKAGFTIKAADFSLPKADLTSAKAALAKAGDELAEATQKLTEFGDLARRCIVAGIEARRIARGPVPDAERLAAILESLQNVFPVLNELRDQLVGQGILIANLGNENSEGHISRLRTNSRDMNALLDKVQSAIGSHLYPFPHPKGQLTVGELISMEVAKDTDPIFESHQKADRCVTQLYTLYFQSLGRLAQLAEGESDRLAIPIQQGSIADPTRSDRI